MGKKFDSPVAEFAADYHASQEPLFSPCLTLLGDFTMIGRGARTFASRRRMALAQTQELIQQTLTQAWQRRAKFRTEPGRSRGPAVVAWSRRVAERECLHAHRRRRPAGQPSVRIDPLR